MWGGGEGVSRCVCVVYVCVCVCVCIIVDIVFLLHFRYIFKKIWLLTLYSYFEFKQMSKQFRFSVQRLLRISCSGLQHWISDV